MSQYVVPVLMAVSIFSGWVRAEINPDQGIYALSDVDSDQPTDDLVPFAQMTANSKVVGLGESIHTSRGYYQEKFRLIKFLVEKQGFRFIGMETPWTVANAATKYVENCEGDAHIATKSVFHVFRDTSTREMFEWLCRFNQAHPDDKVTFIGYDVQEIETFDVVRDALTKSNIDPTGALAQGLDSCVGSSFENTVNFQKSSEYADIAAAKPIDPQRAKMCHATLAKLRETFQGGGAVKRVHIALDSIEAYQGELEGQSQGDLALSFQARDIGMAKTFIALHEFYGSENRAVNWAHSFHLKKTPMQMPNSKNRMTEVRVMGTFLKDFYGEAYSPFAISAYRVLINWYWAPGATCAEFPTAPTIETELQQQGYANALVDFHGPWFQSTTHNYRDDLGPIQSEDFSGLFYLNFSPGNIYDDE